jgi:hypothetical protein
MQIVLIDSDNFRIALADVRSVFEAHPGPVSRQEHRGGGDVVDVEVHSRGSAERLGTVCVPGLLSHPSHAEARAAIGRGMLSSPHCSIQQRAERDHSWVVLSHHVVGGYSPPSALLWPTHEDYRLFVETGVVQIAAVFREADVPEGRPGSGCVVVDASAGGLGIGRGDTGAAGGGSSGGCHGGGGGSSGASASGDASGYLGGVSKRPRVVSMNASGAPASPVRAVLFTSTSPGSLMEFEADVLLQHELVVSIVCPGNEADIVTCLDTLRPLVVIVSGTHCGTCTTPLPNWAQILCIAVMLAVACFKAFHARSSLARQVVGSCSAMGDPRAPYLMTSSLTAFRLGDHTVWMAGSASFC